MRTILFAAAAVLVTGAAGAAEPTRLDAAQLDWITASTASASIAQEAARSDGAKVEGFDIVDAARSEIEATLGFDPAGGKQPADGAPATVAPAIAAPTIAGKGDASDIEPIVGGGTMAIASGTGAGSSRAFASQTITSTADGKGAPIVTLSTGGLSTGGFTGSGFAGAPTAMPTTMPTTASLGSPSMSLLGGFSAMPSFSLGSGG